MIDEEQSVRFTKKSCSTLNDIVTFEGAFALFADMCSCIGTHHLREPST
jgi:hypothetical protein